MIDGPEPRGPIGQLRELLRNYMARRQKDSTARPALAWNAAVAKNRGAAPE